jgi:hypothetical protein
MISTRDLSGLPDVDGLRRLLRSMAMLDAILMREWQDRYYSFNCKWSKGEQMGSMRNGSGDHFFALFNKAGCWLKGFAHDEPMTPFRNDDQAVWPGVLDAVPDEFAGCLAEPAFDIDITTFCIWRRYTDDAWQVGPIVFPEGIDPDGSYVLLSDLDGKPESYRDWAADYYDRPDLSLSAVRHVYEHRRLTNEVIAELNPQLAHDTEVEEITLLDVLEEDIEEIGYPEGGKNRA